MTDPAAEAEAAEAAKQQQTEGASATPAS